MQYWANCLREFEGAHFSCDRRGRSLPSCPAQVNSGFPVCRATYVRKCDATRSQRVPGARPIERDWRALQKHHQRSCRICQGRRSNYPFLPGARIVQPAQPVHHRDLFLRSNGYYDSVHLRRQPLDCCQDGQRILVFVADFQHCVGGQQSAWLDLATGHVPLTGPSCTLVGINMDQALSAHIPRRLCGRIFYWPGAVYVLDFTGRRVYR